MERPHLTTDQSEALGTEEDDALNMAFRTNKSMIAFLNDQGKKSRFILLTVSFQTDIIRIKNE